MSVASTELDITTNNNSVLARIEDLIGIQHADANWDIDVDAAYSMAVASVVDTIPAEVLLKYTESANVVSLSDDPATLNVDGKKILHITREDADSSAVDRDVKAVSLAEFSRAGNSNSMYFATVLSPVWTLIPSSGESTLNILPIPTADQLAKVYVFPYPTEVPFSDTTERAYANTISGVPNELIQAIVLQTALNVLQAYLGWAVLDEEDQELTSLITAQMQTYKAELATELSRYVEGKVE